MSDLENDQPVVVKAGRMYTVDVGGRKSQARAVSRSPTYPGYWYFEDAQTQQHLLVAINKVTDDEKPAS